MKYDLFSTRRHHFTSILIVSALFLLSSCGGTRVLQANFGNDNINAAPATNQAVGTVAGARSGAAEIKVVGSPAAGLAENKWVLITHPDAPTPETTFTGRFSRRFASGRYGILASLFIPAGAGVVTIQFESVSPAADFFHLDFMPPGDPRGDIRINDDENMRFGHVSRDKTFVVSMSIIVSATAMTANINVIGEGTSGNRVVTIPESLRTIVERFEAVNSG